MNDTPTPAPVPHHAPAVPISNDVFGSFTESTVQQQPHQQPVDIFGNVQAFPSQQQVQQQQVNRIFYHFRLKLSMMLIELGIIWTWRWDATADKCPCST